MGVCVSIRRVLRRVWCWLSVETGVGCVVWCVGGLWLGMVSVEEFLRSRLYLMRRLVLWRRFWGLLVWVGAAGTAVLLGAVLFSEVGFGDVVWWVLCGVLVSAASAAARERCAYILVPAGVMGHTAGEETRYYYPSSVLRDGLPF